MLVVHIISTEDTKDFSSLYSGLDAKVLINPTKKVLKRALNEEMECIMFIGHGTEYGLLNERLDGYSVDCKMVDLLRNKTIIGIWCYAGNFAQKYDLKGFFTSNFISNVDELVECGFEKFDNAEKVISFENDFFSSLINGFLKMKLPLWEWVESCQNHIIQDSQPFIKYNYEALYFGK